VDTAAIVAALLIAVVAVFQIALALGAPARRAAWGGRHEGKLPTGLRVASGIAGVLFYPAVILIVLQTGGVIDLDPVPVGATGMWVLAGLFTVGALMNFVSRSNVERVWGPVSLAIAACCAVLAAGI
jgi:hypothetical protein